jgi:hypothetical protein
MSLFEETEKDYQSQLQNKAQQKQKGYQEQLDNKTQQKVNEFNSVNPIDNYERNLWQTDDRVEASWQKEVSYQGQREDEIGGVPVQTQGSVDAHINVGAEAYAKSQGTLTSEGLQASAEVGARAGVEVETNANINSTAEIGNNTVEANAESHASAAAEVSAQGTGELNATAENIGVKGEGDAFAGARASAEGAADIGIDGEKFGEAGGKAEASAGIGGKGTFDAGYDHGELTFNYGVGAALGVGTYMEGTVKVNPEAMGRLAEKEANELIENDPFAQDVKENLGQVQEVLELAQSDPFSLVENKVNDYVDNSWNQVETQVNDYVDDSWNQVETQANDYVNDSWNQVESQTNDYVEDAGQTVEDFGNDVADEISSWSPF